MKKSAASILVVVLQLILGVIAEAQQPKKVFRIGYLAPGDAAGDSMRVDGIRRALRELGYTEGQNLVTEYRYAGETRDRYDQMAVELTRLKVDIIVVAGGDPAIRAAINATKMIPIVMTGGGLDPVEGGYIGSLARPGGNITGITFLNRDLGGKRLELLKEAVPKVARVAVLYYPASPAIVRGVKEDLPVAASSLGLSVQLWEVRDAAGLENAFAGLNKQHPDGLYVHNRGPLLGTNEKRIVGFALKSLLPSIYIGRESVDAGGLMSYGADRADSYRRIAYFVDRILKGAKPADLPVEQPTKFELVFNLKTAKQIGLTIPPEVLARANKLIK